jgi:hypothetical protein
MEVNPWITGKEVEGAVQRPPCAQHVICAERARSGPRHPPGDRACERDADVAAGFGEVASMMHPSFMPSASLLRILPG